MGSGNLHILPTVNTPEYLFNSDGMIKIRGLGLFGNNFEVNKEIMNWIDEYLVNPAKITYVIIAFEYLNSFSTIILVSILRILSQVLQSGKLVIQWYYEEDDEDILERGEYISSTFNIPINFILNNDIAEL